MQAVPMTLRHANAFIREHHRHCLPVRGCVDVFAVAVRGKVVGVAVTGRPTAPKLQDGFTLEITRLCVLDGVSELHVCSALYGRCVRVAREKGYTRVVTFTLASEKGTSLRAAGFKPIRVRSRKEWDSPSRPRQQKGSDLFGEYDKRPTEDKVRWEREVGRRSAKRSTALP